MGLKLKVNNPLVFWVVFIGIILFRLWLIAGVPKMYIYGPHDDLYYAKAAHYIIRGEWLGSYDEMTLIKTPFYAIFLIISFFTGLPLFLNETIFYVIACVIFYISIAPLINNRWLLLIIFVVLLFCPASLATNMTLRVYREFIYYSLTLFVVAFSIGLLLRLERKISTLLWWVFGLGISMGAFMLTREEGVWIYPVLILMLVVSVFLVWKKKYDRKWIRSGLILLPIILWYIPIITVSTLNYSYYGYWGISEQLDSDFNRVLNTLDRIKTDEDSWHPAIQVPEEARMKAYEVSPLFNSLKEEIESVIGGWNISDELAMQMKSTWYINQYGGSGNEISNGHFLWILRGSVAAEGYYADGKFPGKYYKALADQLVAACENGRLDCSKAQVLPFVGSIDQRHLPLITHMFFENIKLLLNQYYLGMSSLDVLKWPSWPENYSDYLYFDEFTYNSIEYIKYQVVNNDTYIINGNLDVRLRILPYKETIMRIIAEIFNYLNLPIFITGFVAWILISVLAFTKRQSKTYYPNLIITFFTMGLLISRLMTLTIVDATTSVPGMLYGSSSYIFLYLFSLISLFWFFNQLKSNFSKQG